MQQAPTQSDEDSQEAAASVEVFDSALADFGFGPGDVLDVSLTGLEDATTSNVYRCRVDDAGAIDLPLVGSVRVMDLRESQAEDVIKRGYVPNIVRQLTANVTVIEHKRTEVLVTGAVGVPGMVSLRHNERNLLFAVLAADGVSSGASGKVTLHRVRRPGQDVTYDLGDPQQLEGALAEDPLEKGDIVMVAAAQPNTIFVGGLVNRPSPQLYPPGVEMNVLQVLASAGGLREDVYPVEGTLIRRMPNGSDMRVKLDFPRIKRGEDANIVLAAGDILWVPETVGTKVLDFFNRNLFIRGGATITYNATGTEFLNSNSRSQSLQGRQGGTLEDQFDPFSFLNQASAINH